MVKISSLGVEFSGVSRSSLFMSFLLLSFFSPSLLAEQVIDKIPILVLKKEGTAIGAQQKWASHNLASLDFSAKNRQVDRFLYDLQYGKSYDYTVVNLFEYISTLQPPSHVNTANLVFANGMIIPMPLNSSQGPLVWLAWSYKDQPRGAARRSFPVVEKQSNVWRDPRPIRFTGNKVVVSNQHFFPRLEGEIKDEFSPFKHADSLIRIELLDYREWNQQFIVSSLPAAIRGGQVFAERCQFCHGLSGRGASFGWDFVTPLPTFEQRGAQSLLYHVKYPRNNAIERGLMMPNQASISEQEAEDLWMWMREAAKNKR